MLKALFLIVPDGFRDEEYSIPKEIFEKNNIQVITASTVSGPLTGKRGLTTAHVDLLLKDALAKDYDTLVVVGGQRTFWHNQKIINLIKEMHNDNKVIGAICSSAVLPAQAGLMQGKRGTAFPGAPEIAELEKYGVVYAAKSVEADNNIVTADGPQSAAEFAQKIIQLLLKH